MSKAIKSPIKTVLAIVIAIGMGALMAITTETVLTSTESGKAYAAKSPSMVKSKTIYKGQLTLLKVKGATGAIKWSSSKKSVATVDYKGLVTAKSNGKTTIYAKAGKKKLACKIKVVTPSSTKRSSLAQKSAKRIVKKLINKGMSRADKAFTLYSFLSTSTVIQTNQSNAAYKKNFGNEAYAALVMSKAACSGHCKAYTLLCKAAGIPVKHVNAGAWTHQWNKVKIGSKWYKVDTQGGAFDVPSKMISKKVLGKWNFGVCSNCGYKYTDNSDFSAHCVKTGCSGSAHAYGWCAFSSGKQCKTCKAHKRELQLIKAF